MVDLVLGTGMEGGMQHARMVLSLPHLLLSNEVMSCKQTDNHLKSLKIPSQGGQVALESQVRST